MAFWSLKLIVLPASRFLGQIMALWEDVCLGGCRSTTSWRQDFCNDELGKPGLI